MSRNLPHPDRDIEDQGLAFDVQTILSRRKLLQTIGIGASAAALAACAPKGATTASTSASAATATAAALAEMNTETAGPYPGDGSNGPDVLDMSGIARQDLTVSLGTGTKVDGVPMTLKMQLQNLQTNQPYANAAVYLWHCDPQGRYSMYSNGVTGETWLRGVQLADATGTVTFHSIIPGCYDGRWPHIHFEVFEDINQITDAKNNVLTSQLAIPEAVCQSVYADSRYTGSAANLNKITLKTDNVFSDGSDLQIPQVGGDAKNGYELSISVGIDPSTEQKMQSMPMPPNGNGAPMVPAR